MLTKMMNCARRQCWMRCAAPIGLAIGLILVLAMPGWSQTSPMDLFAVTEMDKVFADGYQCPAPRVAIDVFGLRNEVLSGQCVIRAASALGQVTVQTGPLRQVDGAATIPAEAVQWNFVGSVPLTANSLGAKASAVIRPAPARFPEFLSEETSMSLDAGTYQPVWVTIQVPRDAAPGRYAGTLEARSNAGTATLPLYVTVYPLTMPDQRHLPVVYWYSTGRFAQFHDAPPNSERFWEVLAAYAANMAAHRQNSFRVELNTITIRRDAQGAYAFDFSRFDRWSEIFWKTGRMDWLETGFVARFGEGGWSGPDVVLREFPVITATGDTARVPGAEILPQFLPAIERHLRERGWLDKTWFHIADEPSENNVVSWRKASEFVHQYAPNLRRMDAIEGTNFWGTLEVWVPKLNHLYTWLDQYRKAQQQGAELWFYQAMSSRGVYPDRWIDVPLLETRLIHWINVRYAVPGYLHYGLNSWNQDPFNEMNRDIYGIGGHWIVYPKRDGLINTIRWETMRSSAQDYEYFWLLEDAYRRQGQGIGGPAGWFDPARRGLELAARVMPTIEGRTRDPNVLYETRRQIIEEILALEQPPRLIVQTNPLEGSRVLNGPGSMAVMGWTEPGTTGITLGQRQVLVREDGFFSANAGISPESNVVQLTAQSPRGRKVITRRFDVVQ